MLFVSTRILVVDLLTKRVPIHLISGFLVHNAHKYNIPPPPNPLFLLLSPLSPCLRVESQKHQQRHLFCDSIVNQIRYLVLTTLDLTLFQTW